MKQVISYPSKLRGVLQIGKPVLGLIIVFVFLYFVKQGNPNGSWIEFIYYIFNFSNKSLEDNFGFLIVVICFPLLCFLFIFVSYIEYFMHSFFFSFEEHKFEIVIYSWRIKAIKRLSFPYASTKIKIVEKRLEFYNCQNPKYQSKVIPLNGNKFSVNEGKDISEKEYAILISIPLDDKDFSIKKGKHLSEKKYVVNLVEKIEALSEGKIKVIGEYEDTLSKSDIPCPLTFKHSLAIAIGILLSSQAVLVVMLQLFELEKFGVAIMILSVAAGVAGIFLLLYDDRRGMDEKMADIE